MSSLSISKVKVKHYDHFWNNKPLIFIILPASQNPLGYGFRVDITHIRQNSCVFNVVLMSPVINKKFAPAKQVGVFVPGKFLGFLIFTCTALTYLVEQLNMLHSKVSLACKY